MKWFVSLILVGLFGAIAAGSFIYWSKPTPDPTVADTMVVKAEKSPLPSQDLLLPESERKFIWACEHGGNLLGQVGFSRMSSLLKSSKPDDAVPEDLAKLMTDEFSATVPDDELELKPTNDTLLLCRAKSSEKTPRSMNANEFARWMLSIRSRLDQLTYSPRFELISYRPVDRRDPSGDWTGNVRLRLTGTVKEQKPCDMAIRFDFQTKAPETERLKKDAWLVSCNVTQVDILQASHVLMREVASERGIDTKSLFDNWDRPKGERIVTTGGVYLCDFDRDGYTDVLITSERSSHSTQFYRGRPEGRFEDITHKIGLPDIPIARHVAVVDIDNDGWEDLFFLQQGVFRNRSGKIFQNVTTATNILPLIEAKGMTGLTGVTVADYDRDGLIDLYITRGDDREFKSGSWVDGKSQSLGNQLLRNRGEGMFEDVTEATRTSGGQRSVFTANWFDANDDGWPDLYIIHEFGAGALLVNKQDGTFEERQIADHSEDFGSMGLATGDLDNDGQIDIYASNMYSKAGNRVMDHLSTEHYDEQTLWKLRRMVAGSQLHINSGNLKFAPMADQAEIANVGWGWGATLVDLDNDGWLDIHATCGFMSYDRSKPDG